MALYCVSNRLSAIPPLLYIGPKLYWYIFCFFFWYFSRKRHVWCSVAGGGPLGFVRVASSRPIVSIATRHMGSPHDNLDKCLPAVSRRLSITRNSVR